MGINDNKWLHVSVFYKMGIWNTLLFKCVHPFLLNTRKNGYLSRFLIHLNTERGENLRLSFQVKNDRAKEFLEEITGYLKTYMQACPSPDFMPVAPGTTFMMDFPANSIFFRLHQCSQLPAPEMLVPDIHDFQYALSTAIIKAFETEEFEEGMITTFYSYTGLSFFAVYEEVRGDLTVITGLLLNRLEQIWNDKQIQSMKKLFSIQKEELLETVAECFSLKGTILELDWLSAWRLSCREFIKTMISKVSPEYLNDAILNGFDRIAQQLNLSERTKMLNWMLLKAISDFIETREGIRPAF